MFLSVTHRLRQSIAHLLWPRTSSEGLGPLVERYLREQAPSRLGLGAGDLGRAESVAQGRNTLVRRLESEQLGVLFVRAWRYDLRDRPARDHRQAGDLLAGAELTVPEILLRDDSWSALRRYRLELIIERAAQGRSLGSLRRDRGGRAEDDWWRAVARATATLHARTGPAWGKPWRAENEMADPRAYWLGRFEKLLARIPPHLIELDADRVRREIDRLARCLPDYASRSPALVHGDLTPAHLFIDDSGRLTWIDFETVHFGHPAEDLATLRRWIDPGDPFDRFLEVYLESGSTATGGLSGEIEYFERVRLLEKLSSRIVKRTHRPERMSPPRAEQLSAEQRQAEQMLALKLDNSSPDGASAS